MSVYKSDQIYKKVLDELQADGFSQPILAADFKSVDLSLFSDAGADYDLCVGVSFNKDTPPDPSLPPSVDNDYTEDIAFIDDGNGATYNNAYTSPNPYNPSSADGGQEVSKKFRFNTNNAYWVYIRVFNYSGGTISANMMLSDNS